MKKANKWDEAIGDAKAKLSALRKTLKYFEKMKQRGERWPGEAALKAKSG